MRRKEKGVLMMCGKLVKSGVIVFFIIFSIQYYAFAEGAMPDPIIKGVEFEVGDNPIQGSSSAPLIIVQFSDYTCSHCARHVKETYPKILKEYINTGKLRYVVVDYPLPGNLPAIKASEAALCADDQGRYWEMHDEIMFDQASLNDLTSIASFVDLDMGKFESCMEAGKYADNVSANISLATKLEIPSVPGFIVAYTDLDNPQKVKGISYIRGAKPFEIFQQEIDKALESLTK